uniref:Uncharacterized protein n=1 Tax=Pyxicephalus adspersus TaxID=30357 RepID=A0AAV3AHE1_PYXAD|nr:TPA: hypothetical protein GDO54_006734 [Pyxicephalus adspersus]
MSTGSLIYIYIFKIHNKISKLDYFLLLTSKLQTITRKWIILFVLGVRLFIKELKETVHLQSSVRLGEIKLFWAQTQLLHSC